MTQSFKTGDRVRLVQDYLGEQAGEAGVVVDHSLLCTKVELDNGGLVYPYHRRLELVKPEPKFKVGDLVGWDGNDEAQYRIIGPGEDEGFCKYDWRIENLKTGRRLNAYLAELSLIEPAPSQVFKLNTGDTIRNNHTGRIGYVVWGSPFSEKHNGPTRRWVVDESHEEATGAPARAVEEYESHHPGTYEVIEGAPF